LAAREDRPSRLDFKPEHYEAMQLVIALRGCMTRSRAGDAPRRRCCRLGSNRSHQIARPAARRVGIATRNQFDEYRMHARLDRGVVRLLTAQVRVDAQIPGRSPRRWRRFPPGKPISTGSWAAFNRMAQPSFSLLQSASDSGNSENLIFLLFDLPPARWRNRRREPARRAEGAAPYTLVGCAALAKATHANSSRTRVFGQVPGLVKFVRLGGQAAFAVA
jgi:hypothetical protein